MKMHYSHRLSSGRVAQIVGAFLLVPLVGIIVVGIFMAKAEHLFEDKYRLHASLGKSYGLEPGVSVLMNGVPIGKILAVEFTSGGQIDVTLELLGRYRDLVREDSVAQVGKSGMIMGSTEVEISMGSQTARVLADGDVIKAQAPQDYLAMLQDMKGEFNREIKPVLESVQRTVLRVEEITKDVQQVVKTGGRTLTTIEQATKELPAIVASVRRSVANVERTTATLPEIAGSAKKTLATADAAAADVKAATAKLPAVMATAQEAVNNIKATTETIKGVGKDMAPMVRTAQKTLEDVNLIVSGAKRTFPVSTMVKNAPPEATGPQGNGLRSLRGDQLSK
jgi:phospholipid/cholesterol/gamma-HCH transport system substrate-binding protein